MVLKNLFTGQKWSSRHLGFFSQALSQLTHVETYLLDQLVGEGQQPGLYLFHFSLDCPSVSLIPGPSVFISVSKGNFSHRIPTSSRLETVTSDMGLSPSSWVLACLCFFYFDICLPLPTAYPMNSKLQNQIQKQCWRLLIQSSNCAMSNPVNKSLTHTGGPANILVVLLL